MDVPWTTIAMTLFFGVVVVFLLILLFLPTRRYVKEKEHIVACAKNLETIGDALGECHHQFGQLPAAIATNDAGITSSWRVRLLPFVGHEDLYEKYSFSEAWDGPSNGPLCDRGMSVYHCPFSADARMTSYVAVIGSQAALMPGRRFGDVRDGTSKTIAVFEIVHSDIPWSEPRDLPASDVVPPKEFAPHSIGAHALFLDGSTRMVPRNIHPEVLRALLTVDASDETGGFFQD